VRIPTAGWSSFRSPPTSNRAASRLAEPVRLALLELLSDARQQHFLGSDDVEALLAHSLGFPALVPDPPAQAVDLGSGAGIPGLVLALVWPSSCWTLLDANLRRTQFVRHAVATLGLADRVEVVTDRAELVGRHPRWRSAADLVVARGFGPPAVVAECGAPLLRVGGSLVVAEPPGGAPERWPADGLELLGLASDGRATSPIALQRLRQVRPCSDRYPRRVGIPLKRPLF
jgi:16S rRNA (guanine527-N7)-methyltransferase